MVPNHLIRMYTPAENRNDGLARPRTRIRCLGLLLTRLGTPHRGRYNEMIRHRIAAQALRGRRLGQ